MTRTARPSNDSADAVLARARARITLEKGMRFRAIYADSMPEWVITRLLAGGGVVEAEVPKDAPDWGGTCKVFKRAEVVAAIRAARAQIERQGRASDFYSSLSLGQTVHYHNGFGQFVRCIVVHEIRTEAGSSVGRALGTLALLPVALVGEWGPRDLPYRNADGSLALPFHVKQIQDRSAWRPSPTCVYESPDFTRSWGARGAVDPRSLPAIDLTPPPVKDEARAALVRAVQAAYTALNDWSQEPEQALRKAQGIIEAALARADAKNSWLHTQPRKDPTP